MKTCGTCLLEKPLDEFYSRGGTEKGKKSSCAKCCNARRKRRKRNPEVGRQSEHRRRVRKIGNGVFKIIPKDLQRLQRTPCQECGTMKKLTIDHVVPISKGGTHSIGNLQSLCLSCNCSKNNKFIIERKLANANRR